MRTMTPLVAFALALSFLGPAPAAAQPLEELGASVWHTVPFLSGSGFGFRESLSLTADSHLTPGWFRLRPGLRVSSAAAIEGRALRQPAVQLLGNFYEISPSLAILAGRQVAGQVRLQAGLGLAYHLRFAQTDAAAVALPIVPGAPAFGTVREIGFTYDPGVDALAEAEISIPLGFRVVVGGGASFASARMIVQPREDPNVEVSIPELFFTWHVQLGLRFTARLGQEARPPGGEP